MTQAPAGGFNLLVDADYLAVHSQNQALNIKQPKSEGEHQEFNDDR
jgi:hypothetical protein